MKFFGTPPRLLNKHLLCTIYYKAASIKMVLLLLKQSGQDRNLIKMKMAKEKRDHDIGFLCHRCIVVAWNEDLEVVA